MKNYPHILSKVYRQPWAILPERHLAIQRILESKLAGEDVSVIVENEEEKPEVEERDSTVIIPIHGIIGKHLSMIETMCGGCDLDQVDEWLRLAANDDAIERVILDIRSPGGTVTGVPEAARRVAELASQKEVIAFTDSEMCSAAYYIGSQADEVLATESAAIGSIGVYMALLDQSRMLENEGIKINAISAGKFKMAGAWFKPLTDEERAMFQADVDKCYAQFKAAVTSKRRVADSVMQGQVFDGEQAGENNLIDAVVESIDDVLERDE